MDRKFLIMNTSIHERNRRPPDFQCTMTNDKTMVSLFVSTTALMAKRTRMKRVVMGQGSNKTRTQSTNSRNKKRKRTNNFSSNNGAPTNGVGYYLGNWNSDLLHRYSQIRMTTFSQSKEQGTLLHDLAICQESSSTLWIPL